MAQQNRNFLQNFRWETLELPPYGLDLTPSDLCLFPALKEQLLGYRFTCNEDVKFDTITWLTQEAIISMRPRWTNVSHAATSA
jgi:hypothetical protein